MPQLNLTIGSEQEPVCESQVPARWHGSDAEQWTGFKPTQAPVFPCAMYAPHVTFIVYPEAMGMADHYAGAILLKGHFTRPSRVLTNQMPMRHHELP